jgi:type III secretion protein L
LTTLALTDTAPMMTAVAGQRIPRRAWAEAGEMNNLLTEAERILQTAKRQAELLQRRAYFDGRAAGIAHAQAEAIKHILEGQKQARELVSASEARIVELAVAIVARIAPRLDQEELISTLVAEALAAIRDERHVTIRVGTAAERATRTMLDRWQCEHPEVETVDVVIDPSLQPLTWVVETELGRIEVGWSAQLDTVRTALLAVASEPAV